MQHLKKIFCLYQPIDCYEANLDGQAAFYAGHKITVLIWPICFSKCLSTLDF